MPEVPLHEDIEPAPAIPPEKLATLPSKVRRWLDRMGPFEFRHAPVDGHGPRDELNPPKRPPYPRVWFRLAEKVGDAPELPPPLPAHPSDFQLPGPATFPHGTGHYQPTSQK